MKTTISVIALILSGYVITAQVSVGTVAYNKVERTAIVGQFDYSPEVVKASIVEDLKYNGFVKSSDSKGFKMYPGIIFTQISPDPIDLYFKVDDVKKEKDKSMVYLMISKGGENFMNNTTDPEVITTCSNYLQSLKPKFEARQLEINIAEQESLIKKAEKTYNSLIGTGESLQDKKNDIEESIAKNLKEQEAQKTLLEKEKKLLETLKSQRK